MIHVRIRACFFVVESYLAKKDCLLARKRLGKRSRCSFEIVQKFGSCKLEFYEYHHQQQQQAIAHIIRCIGSRCGPPSNYYTIQTH
jgi:excinuclease UvrABC helicase subunit UvrB